MFETRVPSRDRLQRALAAHGAALRAMTGDALYNVQVRYTCDLLDVVFDEITDEHTAARITDLIAERLTVKAPPTPHDVFARRGSSNSPVYRCTSDAVEGRGIREMNEGIDNTSALPHEYRRPEPQERHEHRPA